MSDDHHARQPNFPYEPTLRALLATQTSDDSPNSSSGGSGSVSVSNSSSIDELHMRTVDIFTDAQVLTQLFTLIAAPSQSRPFRLELATVRNTLFLEPGRHHGQGHTDKGGPVKRGNSRPAVWVGDALRRVGFEAPRLPFSGSHYRVVRYRLGGVVCAVRSQVDFTCGGGNTRRKMKTTTPCPSSSSSSRVTFDPLRGVRPETIVTPVYPGPCCDGDNDNDGDDHENGDENKYLIETWRTTVKHLGRGTKPDQAGRSALRFAWESDAAYLDRLMRTELPMLWFSRTSYLLDTILSQNLTVLGSKLRCVRGGYYRGFEHAHQTDLRLLAALLRQMKQVTRRMGGTCVLVCDPVQRCFMVMTPVVKKCPVPEEIAVRLWGGTANREEETPAETEYESTAVSESSGLTTLRSKTPSGFTGWGLDDPKAGVSMDADYHRSQRDAASRALVNQWLSRHRADDYGDDMDYDIDDFSSDDLAPADSQSHRGEDSSLEEDSDDERYGADGSMEVGYDQVEFEDEFADDEASASEENKVAPRRHHASDLMDVDDVEGDDEYDDTDEEYDDYEDQDESQSENGCLYASIEHDQNEGDGDEYDEEDGKEYLGDYGGSDEVEYHTVTEERESSTNSTALQTEGGSEELEDSDMVDAEVLGWATARSARTMIPEELRRFRTRYYH